MQFAGGNGLQFSEQNVRVGIAAGNERAQRANHQGEEDVRAAGQIDNRLRQRGDNPAEIHHRGQRDDRHNCDDRVLSWKIVLINTSSIPRADAPE